MIDLAEYINLANVPTQYLLQQSKMNSTLKVAITLIPTSTGETAPLSPGDMSGTLFIADVNRRHSHHHLNRVEMLASSSPMAHNSPSQRSLGQAFTNALQKIEETSPFSLG
jgi:hypothetical protein